MPRQMWTCRTKPRLIHNSVSVSGEKKNHFESKCFGCFGPDDDNEVEEEVETERFKLWKRNIPFLYDVMMINSLEWPSLTVQWLPETVHVNYRQFVQQKILLGTQAFAGNDNYLLIGNLITPIVDDSIGHHNSPHKSKPQYLENNSSYKILFIFN